MAKATRTTAAATKNVPAVKQSQNMAIIDDKPDYIDDSKSRGNEGIGLSDIIVPRLEVVQALSPCLDESEDAYIEGCKAGDLYNSVTRKLYGEQAYVVPVVFRKEYNVWVKRKKGEATGKTNQFKGSFPSMEAAEAKLEEVGADKHEIIETPMHFCLLVDQESGLTEQIVVSMPKTKYKVSRKWNSLIQMSGGDRFSRVYKLYGTREENDFGKFFNFNVMPVGYPSKPLYMTAADLYQKVKSGLKLRAADEPDTDAGEGEADAEY